MALRQMRTAETMYVSDAIADGVTAPPTADAVFDAVPTAARSTVYEKILMSANDKTYEVTIDSLGALKVTEQTS